MKLTRREALEVVATATVAAVALETAEQTANAQPANSVTLHWLDGAAPPIATGVSWGVPFPRGTVSKTQNFALTAGGNSLPLQQWPLAYWPDGSMKFVGFATVAAANTTGELRLAPGAAVAAQPMLIQQENTTLVVDTGVLQCRLNTRGSDFIASMKLGGQEVARQGRLICTLENRSNPAAISFDDFASNIKSVTVEQTGPVRSVVKIDGMHKAERGNREWLPFTVRLYFYAGQSDVRMIHSIIFDGDHEKDFIRGLGVAFAVPMREQMHNRHMQFTGDDGGVWAEPLQPSTGRRVLTMPGAESNLFAQQLDGKRLPNKEAFPAAGQKLLTDWAVWDSYKLVQPTADGFVIQKRTNPESCWLDAAWGRRATGLAFVGDVSGGLSVGLKNMWQSHPTALEVRNGTTTAADLRVWLWSPDAPAMDLRHYDTKAHDLDSSYEDVQPGFSTPHGVARTSELMLFPSAGVPSHEDTARHATLSQQPPLLMASPQQIHAAKVFGIWSLPNRSNAARSAMEDHLDAAFALYHKEVEQRHWYGFWNFGDVMHAHDGPRHAWRYDIGGFAWDNTELGTDVWLWYHFLRTGRSDAFRMAEAMTRHTSEVDTYHLGRFQGLGSRHNVRHWGCGAKESRISQAAYRRFYYYLTTDERTGDLMRAVVDIDYKLLELDPMRLASPVVPGQNPYPARVRGGPDWLAFVGNWMTEWERTGETKYRDKIIAGMDSIAAMPYGFLSGPDQLYGYNPANGKMVPLIQDGYGVYNLTTIMGGAEVVFELNELIDHAGWRKAWKEYCLLTKAPKDVAARDRSNNSEGADGEFAQFGRCAGYVYLESKNVALAKKAWTLVRVPTYATTHFAGPAVLEPIDEVTGVSTNSTAQSCLEAIELLEMCGDQLA
jgi:YetA-like protein